jgi:hypothetical protein
VGVAAQSLAIGMARELRLVDRLPPRRVVMTRQACVGAVVAIVVASGLTLITQPVAHAGDQAAASISKAAADAAKASPELVGMLSKELGGSEEQAAGAAGALFGVAKSQLKGNDWSQIAKAVPGMSALLKAAPAMGGSGGSMEKMAGSMAGMAAATSAFSKLGLSPEMVSKAVPVLTQFVTKKGGANVGQLLAGVLK